MQQTSPQFARGAVQSVASLKAGWNLIKDQYWLFLGMAFVGVFIGSMVPMGVLLGPMMCGIHLALFRRSQGEAADFSDLMKGFDYFGQSLIATLIQIIPMMIIIVPVYLIGTFGLVAFMAHSANSHRSGSPADLLPMFLIFGSMILIIIAISMVVGAFFVFTYPLIVDRQMSGVDAVKTSAKAVLANLGGVFGLMTLTFLLGFAGMLLCYVGAFLIMPVAIAGWHVAYKQVFGIGPRRPRYPPPPPSFT